MHRVAVLVGRVGTRARREKTLDLRDAIVEHGDREVLFDGLSLRDRRRRKVRREDEARGNSRGNFH